MWPRGSSPGIEGIAEMRRRQPTIAFEASPAPEQTAAETLDRLRTALREGDVGGVISRLETVRSGKERDLLSDLVVSQGPEKAVKQLQRFWRHASATVTGERWVHDHEVEIYEDITMPDRETPLHSVTLLRRRDHRWHVVSTQNAPDLRPRLRIYCAADVPALDGAGFTRQWAAQHGPTAELMFHEGEGILNHPLEGWVGSVRGPVPLEDQRSEIPSVAAALIEVAVEPSRDAASRGRQLVWISRVTLEIAAWTNSRTVHVPAAERFLDVADFAAALGEGEMPAPHRIASTWVKLHRREKVAGRGYAATRGMSHFLQPEIEFLQADFSEQPKIEAISIALASAIVSGRLQPTRGSVVRISGARLLLDRGRRGPLPGETYGRYGAVRLLPATTGPLANNRTHQRLNAPLAPDSIDGGGGDPFAESDD